MLCVMDVDCFPRCTTTHTPPHTPPKISASKTKTQARGIIHPLGHQSRAGLTLSARTIFPRLKSGCWPSCLFIWGLTIKQHSISRFTQLPDGLEFPASRPHGLADSQLPTVARSSCHELPHHQELVTCSSACSRSAEQKPIFLAIQSLQESPGPPLKKIIYF